MSLAGGIVLPLAGAYARHVGLPEDAAALRARLEARLSAAPPLSVALTVLGALFVRWLAPALLLARPRRFDGLSEGDRERLLGRLQRAGSPALRGLFFGVRPLLLSLCYGLRDPGPPAGRRG